MTLSLLCEVSGGCKKILQSNLDYPGIDYPDFSIIQASIIPTFRLSGLFL